MNDTKFILEFLSELERDLREIGVSSIIDLQVRCDDMVLENPKTLGVMYVDGFPMYILTSQGRVRILRNRHLLKTMKSSSKQELKDLFFLKYGASLSSYKLNSSKVYSIKKIPGKVDYLEDISLRMDFSKDRKDVKSRVIEPLIFNEYQRVNLGLKTRLFVESELRSIQKENGWCANYLTVNEFVNDNNKSGDFDSNRVFLTDDDISMIGSLVELGIVKVGLMSGSFRGDIRDFCYSVLSGLKLYLDDLDIASTKKRKIDYLIDKYCLYFSLNPKEVKGDNLEYCYDRKFLNGIGVFEILRGDEVVFGYSDNGEIRIDNSNKMVCKNKKLERIRRYNLGE